MAAPKGHPRYGGRTKGMPNKLTAEVRSALAAAFDKVGGVKALVKWGKENQTEFYKLWSKLLPLQVATPEGEELLVKVIDLSRGPDGNQSTSTEAAEARS